MRKVFAKVKRSGKALDEREQPDIRDAVRVEADDILEIMMVDMRIAEDDVWSRKRGNVYRKLLIYGLRRHTASSLKEIGEIMSMDYSAVSGLARRFEREMKTHKNHRRLAERLAKEVMKRRVLKG
jgi:chromosomal replication initiation ATPase DnaA